MNPARHEVSASNFASQVIWQRHRENGEPLILAIHAEGLRGFHRATVLRWVLSGKIPALKIGRRFLTTQSLVDEWVSGGRAASPPKAETKAVEVRLGRRGAKPKTNAHAEAVEILRKKGLMN